MFNDPRLKNEYTAWFTIYGFEFSPDEITKQLGIEPTDTRVKGEYRITNKKTLHKMLNKENLWILNSKLPRNDSIEKHIEYLLDTIKLYKQNFLDVSKKYSLEFNCAMYYYEANPGFNLSNKILKEIAELNAEIGFDIYCLEGTVRQLEEDKEKKDLIEQLSNLKFISKYNDEKTNEASVLVDSLSQIEAYSDKLKGILIPDLIWDEFTEEEWKLRLDNITKELNNLTKAIYKSKFLQNAISKKV